MFKNRESFKLDGTKSSGKESVKIEDKQNVTEKDKLSSTEGVK
jgi:hypothetical protein